MHLPLKNSLGDTHLSLQATDKNVYIVLLTLAQKTSPLRLGLGWDSVPSIPWESRTVCDLYPKNKTASPLGWLIVVDGCSDPLYSLLIFFSMVVSLTSVLGYSCGACKLTT